MSGILSRLLGSAAAAITDAYFNLVTLLLNTSSTNGAQNNTFLDSSTNNFSITRNGNTTQGTFTPFSQTGWSNYFDGTGDYLAVPSSSAFSITGDFTYEGWVYVTSTSASRFITPSSVSIILDVVTATGNNMKLQFYDGSNVFVDSVNTFSINTWAHIAVVRSGASSNNCSFYVNGVRGTQFSTNATNSSPAIDIGRYSGGGIFYGYIGGLRIVKGQAVYSGTTYTIPNAPLTTTGYGSTSQSITASNTSLLTCQSNRFLDTSTNAFAITANGDTSVQAFSPFAPTTAYDAATVGGSGYFDGTGDFLGFTGPTIGTGAFCLEAWVYCTSTFTNQAIFGADGTTNNISVLINNSTTISIDQYGVSGSNFTVAGLNLNAWNHIAFSRNGSSVATVFINGVRSSTGTATLSNNYATFNSIGRFASSDARSPTGYISGVRAIIGSTPYDPTQTTCTVPTAPPTAIANTSLLTNFTNAGIFDSAAKNDLETVGNAQVSTTQAKWDTTSMYFDGSGDYLAIPSGYNLGFGTGDFTIEGWLYLNATSGYSTIMSNRPNGSDTTTGRWSVAVRSSAFEFYANGSQIISAGTVSTSAWTHFAVTRASGSLRLFLGGTQVGSTTSFTTDLSSLATWVGANGAGTEPINAYIDDLRISKFCRYTTTFTPATAAFPLQ